MIVLYGKLEPVEEDAAQEKQQQQQQSTVKLNTMNGEGDEAAGVMFRSKGRRRESIFNLLVKERRMADEADGDPCAYVSPLREFEGKIAQQR